VDIKDSGGQGVQLVADRETGCSILDTGCLLLRNEVK
jgi:hypothetical protein